MQKIFIFITISFISSFQLVAQVDKLYPVEHLKEDFQILRSCLEKNHAGLYSSTSNEALDGICENATFLAKFVTNLDYPDEGIGITPDIPIKETIHDLIKKRDVVLQ